MLLAYRTHAKLVSVFRNSGWSRDDPLRIDGIDVGVIDLMPEPRDYRNHKSNLRLQAYVYVCDPPDFKYRDGGLGSLSSNRCSKKPSRDLPTMNSFIESDSPDQLSPI